MTEAQGIVLQADDERVRRLAARQRLPMKIQSGCYDLPWERTLFLDPAIGRVPWEQIPRGFGFLAQWEVAAPVWSYETLAADVATGAERERTETLVGDLRVPLYETGLLFVRRCEAGEALLEAWQAEYREGGEPRLAFLRALCRVKPLFLALPRSWLAGGETGAPRWRQTKLVRVEIAPGRYVMCRPGEEGQMRERFARLLRRRR